MISILPAEALRRCQIGLGNPLSRITGSSEHTRSSDNPQQRAAKKKKKKTKKKQKKKKKKKNNCWHVKLASGGHCPPERISHKDFSRNRRLPLEHGSRP